MIDERRLREIAKSHAWPEDQFVASIRRLVEGYGYTLDQALQQVERTFAQRYGLGPTPAPGPGSGEKPAPHPEVAKEGGGDEQKTPTQSPDPRLTAWLEAHGFSRRPDGTCWTRTERLADGRIVQLKVDFKSTPKGSRYAYLLDEETGGWKNAENLRDHPLLLEFKAYRDKLLAEEAERAKPRQAPAGSGPAAPAGGGEEQQLLLRMEEKDEQQIVAELKGDFQSEVLKQYFYSFEQGGRRVVGLSYKGVKQIMLKQGNIRLKELELRETPDAWIAIVKARHETRNIEVYGAAWQPKKMRLRDGGEAEDAFALQKAVGKAQRNAIRALIPEAVIAEAYRAWLERREEWFGRG